MKKSIRKLLILFITVIMTLTTVSTLSISAFADDEYVTILNNISVYFDKSEAKVMSSGKKYSGDSSKTQYTWFKFTSAKSGKIKLNILSKAVNSTDFLLFDNSGKLVNYINCSIDKGSLVEANDTSHVYANKDFSGCFTYKINKGKYYILVNPGSNRTSSGGEFTLSATFPTSDSSYSTSDNTSSSSDVCMAIILDVGDKIYLDASDLSGNITWTSSKNAVAKVNSRGVVTAKSKGTAIIRAKTSKNVIKVKIIVE